MNNLRLSKVLLRCILLQIIIIEPNYANANHAKFHQLNCMDNPNYIFYKTTNFSSPSSQLRQRQKQQRRQKKSCEWVKKYPDKRCNLIDDDSIQVKDRCRATCNNCISSSKRRATTTTLEKQGVGLFCMSDSDCKSNVCRENTCFASEACKSIKHVPGQEFHENTINLVFVGSGFDDMDKWKKAVANTFREFDRFEFFSFSNPRYNAFYVDEHDENSFCHYNCEGIENLLCCDVQKSRELANKCFPTGSQLQMIVIENDEQYGGAGYRYQNLATTSLNKYGPVVAVHELGHSLFELGDEYVTGQFTTRTAPNCDVAGCPKWADLDEHMGGGLCQMKGCQNGNYFVGENSFMRELGAPMGHVNTRYTCCTFLALTKGVPNYCQQYDFGDGLLDYCQNDHQGYGGSEVYVANGRSVVDNSIHGKYIVATKPVRLTIDLIDNSFVYANAEDIEEQGPTLVLRREYLGDYPDLRAVCDTHLKNITIITLEFDTGEIRDLYFVPGDSIDVPPPSSSSMKDDIDVTVESIILEIVIEAERGIVIDLNVEHLEITIWVRIKTWMLSFLRGLFGWIYFSDDANLITK